MSCKVCTACKKSLPLERFPKLYDAKRPDARRSCCSKCHGQKKRDRKKAKDAAAEAKEEAPPSIVAQEPLPLTLAEEAQEEAGERKLRALIRSRDRDAALKKSIRRVGREVVIPPCADRARRQRLEADDIAWLMHYFGPNCGSEAAFTRPFTGQQIEMIGAIQHAIQYHDDQAIAASRGEGKTTLFERLILKYTLQGVLKYSVLCAASGSMADNSLGSIKGAIEDNPLLHADYPEVCVPVRALECTPSRAHYQIVTGVRHDNGQPFVGVNSMFKWCGQEITLPNVPGSPSALSIIATRGLDGAIRGLKKHDKRPQIVGIDDPDTEDTARSPDQATKLEEKIDKTLGGLGDQKHRVARVMLTTLQNRICVSYKYTDPAQKPTFKGKRFRYLIDKPQRLDLWDEYCQLRSSGLQTGDAFGRTAHQFYLDRRALMDAGAVVANPYRFDSTECPDGSPLEISALQCYFNEVVRIGQVAVSCEYDNDPPETTGIVESGITAHRIQRQLSGYPRKVVPPGCTILTQGIDVRKLGLHWVVRAWRPDGTGFTIDYGVYEVWGTVYGSDEGVDAKIKQAILGHMEATKAAEYRDCEGQAVAVDLTLVDAGWKTEAVYAACTEVGLGINPIKGFGKSAGCTQANFYDAKKRTPDQRPGDGWFMSRQGKVWLVCADTDRWKSWEVDRWMTVAGKPGHMSIFGEINETPERLSADEKVHHSYAHHIVAETEVEEPYKGGVRRVWKAKSANTHFLDASYYANVAANIRGIRLVSVAAPTVPRVEKSLAQMAAEAKKLAPVVAHKAGPTLAEMAAANNPGLRRPGFRRFR